jgi:hypothetical protein
LGREASSKEEACGALMGRNWVEGRRDHFRGRGKLEGDIFFHKMSHKVASPYHSIQPKTTFHACITACLSAFSSPPPEHEAFTSEITT